jgi:hypothetical protein
MFVRVVLLAIAAWAFVVVSVSGAGAQGNASSAQPATIQVNTEERALADLDGSGDAFVLSASQPVSRIRFVLPPHSVGTEAWLRLAARPSSDSTDGRIQVTLNGGDPIVIRPQARPMEARFALFSADLQPGENLLEIRYTTEAATPGWIVDARRSQLRLTLEPVRPIGSLDELEQALAADFAAPRRIALDTEPGRQRITLEALLAQGIALRAGEVPLFTGDIASADLVVRLAEEARLEEADRAALRQGAAQGPEIAYRHNGVPRLIVTGRNLDETTAAARLLAARSFAGHDTTFVAADAIRAAQLGRRQIRDASGQVGTDTDLRHFAASGLPFSADQGARTAVQFSARSDADRYGALSVMARAALIGGETWLYAWYGDATETAPANHNLLIVGPNSTAIADVGRNAPEELHAALRAAERSRGQRGLMRLAAAAYADAGDHAAAAPGAVEETGVGVAALFRDRRAPHRWIGTLTAPETASFGEAGRSLARSDLWRALEGRAAVWSSRGVTPLDFAVAPPTLAERAREFAFDHTRDAAFLLFGAALLMLIRGLATRRRRKVHA